MPSRGLLATRRAKIAAAILLAILVATLAYVVARETSIFAVRSVELSVASGELAREVRAALAPLEGESMVALAPSEVERRLNALPSVFSATVDRDFPSTLRVSIRPEQAVAVVRQAQNAWLVSGRGRIIRGVEPGSMLRLPRIWLPATGDPLAPGSYLIADQGGAAARALARLPDSFPGHVAAAQGTLEALVLILEAGASQETIELRLGSARQLNLKLAAAEEVLQTLSSDERANLAYLDVSLPTRPVGAPKSQVET
jgi:cell division protein FtsQ